MPISKIPRNDLSYSLPPPYLKLRPTVSLWPLYVLNSLCHFPPLFFTLAIPTIYYFSITLGTLPMFQDSSYFTSSKKPLYTHPWKSSLLFFTLPLDTVSIFLIALIKVHAVSCLSIVSLIEEWEIILWTRGDALSSLFYLQFFSQFFINSKHPVPACWSEWN